jgi:translation initiation factor 1A
MTINKKGGKKGKKVKRQVDEIERPLILKENGQEYCQVTKLLGNCRVEGNCFDNKIRICNIRGTMRKKVWIKANDIVIVSLREFEDNKADIIYLYQQKEVKKLIKMGEIPENVIVTEEEPKEDLGIEFEESDEDENKQENKNREINFDTI